MDGTKLCGWMFLLEGDQSTWVPRGPLPSQVIAETLEEKNGPILSLWPENGEPSALEQITPPPLPGGRIHPTGRSLMDRMARIGAETRHLAEVKL